MEQPEPNMFISGDDARALMASLATSNASLPASVVVQLWTRLNQLSQVQPPVETN